MLSREQHIELADAIVKSILDTVGFVPLSVRYKAAKAAISVLQMDQPSLSTLTNVQRFMFKHVAADHPIVEHHNRLCFRVLHLVGRKQEDSFIPLTSSKMVAFADLLNMGLVTAPNGLECAMLTEKGKALL